MIQPHTTSEALMRNQFFIFLVSSSPHKWRRNREISNFYMNRIIVEEDDQFEVIAVENLENWDNECFVEKTDISIKKAFDFYQALIEAKVLKQFK